MAPMRPVDQEEKAEGDNRARRRVHVFLRAELIKDGDWWEVNLRNLSCTGARIDCDVTFASGERILFRRGPADRMATVVWVRPNQMGLHFDEPFTEDEVALLTRRLG